MDFLESIEYLRSISEGVDQLISNGAYTLKYDSVTVITDQVILNECYQLVLDELRMMGVVTNWDISEILNDYYQAESIGALRFVLDKDNLKKIFAINPGFCKACSAFLDNDEIMESRYFSEFLDTYQHHFPGDRHMEVISRLEDAFSGTFEFRHYLRHLIQSSRLKTILDSADMTLVSAFLKKIADGRDCYEKAVLQVMRLDPSLDKEYMTHSVAQYDMEKISHHVIKPLSWAVMTDESTLSEEQKKTQKEIIWTHTSTTLHHIEYYLYHMKNPSKENLVELTAHHFEPESSEEKFMDDVNEMIAKGTSDKNPYKFIVFSSEDVNYIKRIAAEIAKLYSSLKGEM